jgi:hypothetical protein
MAIWWNRRRLKGKNSCGLLGCSACTLIIIIIIIIIFNIGLSGLVYVLYRY